MDSITKMIKQSEKGVLNKVGSRLFAYGDRKRIQVINEDIQLDRSHEDFAIASLTSAIDLSDRGFTVH